MTKKTKKVADGQGLATTESKTQKCKYFTKSELAKRWSLKLIEKYFPLCSQRKPSPYYKSGSPMQLYDVNKVAKIESTEAFKADYKATSKRKETAQKTVETKREQLMSYAREIKISIPTLEKDKLIKKACYHYNERNSWKELTYDDYSKATPSSDEEFLKRITINYLRHQLTHYDDELSKFFKKVGVEEAHDILKNRINEAIKQKYEWLR